MRFATGFLQELVLINGVSWIFGADRHAIGLQVGRCFDARRVAVAIARVVCRHFYPGTRVVIRDAGNTETKPPQEISF